MRKHIVTDLMGNVLKVEDMPTDIDPAEYLRQQVHDCPECRAALERGEKPIWATPADLELVNRRRPRRDKPDRWRKRKRG
jgi:hypothetical protein